MVLKCEIFKILKKKKKNHIPQNIPLKYSSSIQTY